MTRRFVRAHKDICMFVEAIDLSHPDDPLFFVANTLDQQRYGPLTPLDLWGKLSDAGPTRFHELSVWVDGTPLPPSSPCTMHYAPPPHTTHATPRTHHHQTSSVRCLPLQSCLAHRHGNLVPRGLGLATHTTAAPKYHRGSLCGAMHPLRHRRCSRCSLCSILNANKPTRAQSM